MEMKPTLVPTEGGVQESGLMQVITGPTMQAMMAQCMPTALGLTTDMLTRVIATEFRRIPQLAQCTPPSFYRAVMQCSELAMVPGSSLGHCWILPYKKEATFVLGYLGAAELAWRSDKLDGIQAHTVYEGEPFKELAGSEMRLVHEPGDWVEGRKVRGYYATLRVRGSDRTMWRYMSLAEVLWFKAKYVKAKSGPWSAQPGTNEFDWMAKKTCFKQVCKLGPKSSTLVSAFNADDRSEMGLAPEIDITSEAQLLAAMKAEGEAVNAEGGFGATVVSGGDEPVPSEADTNQATKLKYAEPKDGEILCDSPIAGGCHRKKGHRGECENADGATEKF